MPFSINYIWVLFVCNSLGQIVQDKDVTLTIYGVTFRHQLGTTADEQTLAIQTFCTEPPFINTTEACIDVMGSVLNLANYEAKSSSETTVKAVARETGNSLVDIEVEDTGNGPGGATPSDSEGVPDPVTSSETTDAGASDPVATAGDDDDAPLTFEVVVKADGTRARFTHEVGGSPKDEIAAFCSENVVTDDGEACRENLLEALETGLAKRGALKAEGAARRVAWKDPASVFNFVPGNLKKLGGQAEVELEVVVSASGGGGEGEEEEGRTEVFAHGAGQDPYAEAEAFCAQHVPSVGPKACSEQLVEALEDHLTSLKALEEDEEEGRSGAKAQPKTSTQRSSSKMAALFGPTLLSPGAGGGQPVETVEALKGAKVVALYFAADWCGPCRQFTPILAKYRARVQGFRKLGFEVVWVSASRDANGFNGYFKEMPWPALPFENRDEFNRLRMKYQVQSFPTLVFVDAATGALISDKARELVANDPNGDGFPYTPPIQVIGRFVRGLYTSLVPSSLRSAIAVKAGAVFSRTAPDPAPQ
mmetsp:Transcript_11724/g.23273  ORF Transcript_11724/g.23273 Transcript_11724/m.23273 type:complete len:534 (+) Transcript_11724:73-1674(+)